MGCASSKSDYVPPELPNKLYTPAYVESLPAMNGKIVAITGASTPDGLGFVCAKTLAMKGAKVILLNRVSERSSAAEKLLKDSVPGADISTVECDLSNFESVRRAGKILNENLGGIGLDILCNNAGVMALSDKATVDGYDIQMQTNHLSHFLLCQLVFPLLNKAAEIKGEARIVNHSSLARSMGGELQAKYLGKNGGNLGGDSSSMFFGGARWIRYGQTKLANVVFTLALKDKFLAKGLKIKALCAAPGLAASQLQKTTDVDGGMGSGTWFMNWGHSAEDGAISLINCCVSPNLKNGDCLEPSGSGHLSGPPAAFFPEQESYCKSVVAREMLWKESENAVGTWDI